MLAEMCFGYNRLCPSIIQTSISCVISGHEEAAAALLSASACLSPLIALRCSGMQESKGALIGRCRPASPACMYLYVCNDIATLNGGAGASLGMVCEA